MCGNCNCGRSSVFCLDEKLIFIMLLICLYCFSSNGCGLLGGGCGCENNCGCERSCGC
ncbi:MAG: hypothetical protein VB100_11855 [Angelakisella sp.]|nr:hypothetical protein [Angelakisella sp.]